MGVTAPSGGRRDQLLDVVLAPALAAVTVADVLTPDPASALPQPEPDAGLVSLALVAALSLAVRRRWPLAVLGVTLAANTAFEWLRWDPGLVGVCVLFALYAVANWRPVPVSLACLAGTYAITGTVLVLRSLDTFSLATLPESGFFAVAWGLGFYARRWRLGREEAMVRALEAERSRAAAVEQAVFAERLRIVRDLHDIVSHTLSVITVQSGVARHLVDERPEQAGPALSAIEEAARAALGDLRRMLGLLRTPSPALDAPPRHGDELGTVVPARRERLLDLLTGLTVTAVAVSSVLTTDPTDAYAYPEPDAWLVLLALGAGLPLTLRRRFPVSALVVVVTSAFTIAGLGRNAGLTPLCMVIALYTVATERPRRFAVTGLAMVYAGMASLALLGAPYFDHPLALVTVAAVTVFWVLGRYARHRRLAMRRAAELALDAEWRRAREAERAVVEERLRIARELHDVVSHTLSVIAVQSGVAVHLIESQPQKAEPALAAIEEAGRTAMEDLRRMSELLQPEAGSAGLAPAPGLDELRLLASVHRAAHGAIELEIDPAVADAPESLRLTVYRVVQEALTNARKHAPGSPVRVGVRAAEGHIDIRVDDDGPGTPATGGGFGLVGMSERVALYDGMLEAGPLPGGGFRVHATLPAATERVNP
ncbi:sensor histidine kinase [Nonomuraea sp. NPDC051941]|uniref:sensor histidine kinase n=1 Tax=Nonomuraea sp. NPDC051941 TaxID=3364373 RepID=UPI0037C66D8D